MQLTLFIICNVWSLKEQQLSLIHISPTAFLDRDAVLLQEPVREIFKARCIVPVSYTHLDVYKRQEYLCVKNGDEQGFTADEFKTAQTEGWEKQYQYKVCLLYTSRCV